MKILGVIVTYNPDIERLSKNIAAVIRQVDELLIVDNNSLNINEIRSICEKEIICIHEFDCNMGIAFALSNGLEYAQERNYDYIFTLDQDSISSDHIIEKLCQGFNEFKNVAISSPEILSIDMERATQEKAFTENEITKVDVCITSGSLCSVSKLLEVGGFNDELFIDEVDHELCYRLQTFGNIVVKNKTAFLFHEIGAPQTRKFLFNDILISNHSAFRQYYITRNRIYISKEFRNFKHVKERNIMIMLLGRSVKIFLCENDKINKLYAIIKGMIDGISFTTKLSNRTK